MFANKVRNIIFIFGFTRATSTTLLNFALDLDISTINTNECGQI